MLVGIGIAFSFILGVLLGFAMAVGGRMKENARALSKIESRVMVTDQRLSLWMKHATTLPSMPAVRSDPRRDPDD